MAEILNNSRQKRSLRTLERLDKRRREGKSDFTIIVGNQKILAERNVLAAGSEYFETIFSSNSQSQTLELLEADFNCVETCIDYIYGKRISFSREKYEDLMYAAEIMLLRAICDAIESEMIKTIDANAFFYYKRIANKFKCLKLEQECKEFAEKNFDSLSTKKEFATASKSFLKSLLTMKHANVSEERKIQIVLDWVRCEEERKKDLLELIKCVDFSQISHNVGQSYIEKEPLINTNTECLLFFTLEIFSVLNNMKTQSQENPSNTRGAVDGKDILIFDRNTKVLRLFNPRESTAETLSLSRPEISHYSITALGSDIYVLGHDNSVYKLSYPDGTTWEKMASMINAHGLCPPVALASGCLYVIGGHHAVITKAAERYDPMTNKWTQLKDRLGAVVNAGLLAVGQHIYSFGGRESNTLVDSVSKFDSKTQEWAPLSSMMERKAYVSAAEWEGTIYVAGGYSGSDHLQSLESYDLGNDQWTLLQQMEVGRSWFRLHAFDGFLYAVGGMNSSPNSIEKYDITRNEWSLMEDDNVKEMRIIESVSVQAM